MDDKKRKALVKELSVRKNFDKEYSEDNRRWFVDKLIRVFEGQNLPDNRNEKRTSEIVQKSKAIVAAKRDFSLRLDLGNDLKATERSYRRRRIEILYGAIATHPEFVEPPNSALLNFIAQRRYRSILRMDLFVNPNELGYFRYPETCASDQRWRVNIDAEPYWTRESTENGIPHKMKLQAGGGVDPVTSLNKLFIKKENSCEGNLFDCATALSIILMDSLLEARDANVLLRALSGRKDTYLSISNVITTLWEFFTTDSKANSLFIAGPSPENDLQVGDHFYINNHPLYPLFFSSGSWRGEHSLLTNSHNRGRNGFRFSGHGAGNTTLTELYTDLLGILQTRLDYYYNVGKIFLNYLQTDGHSLPADRVTTEDHTIQDSQGHRFNARLYLFNIDFSYLDYTSAQARENSAHQKTEHGFVIIRLLDIHQFGISPFKTIEAAKSKPFEQVPFERKHAETPDEQLYDPAVWKMSWTDKSTFPPKPAEYELFQRVGRQITIRQLTIEDLIKLNINAIGTRPKVDFTTSYKNFLTDNKAI